MRSKLKKNREPGVNITPTTYKALIDDSKLRMFLTFGWIKADGIEFITEDQLEAYLKNRANREPNENKISRVERIVSKVKINMKLPLFEDRLCHLVQSYMEVLEANSLSELPGTKPHVAIKHVLNRLRPNSFLQCMEDFVELLKNENLDKKDFSLFIQQLSKQAVLSAR